MEEHGNKIVMNVGSFGRSFDMALNYLTQDIWAVKLQKGKMLTALPLMIHIIERESIHRGLLSSEPRAAQWAEIAKSACIE